MEGHRPVAIGEVGSVDRNSTPGVIAAHSRKVPLVPLT
jgi:hypothetical protein